LTLRLLEPLGAPEQTEGGTSAREFPDHSGDKNQKLGDRGSSPLPLAEPPLPVPLLHRMEERDENICGFDSPFGEAFTGTFVPSPPPGGEG